MSDRVERLTNLVANLLATRRPLTLDEIVDLVPGYPSGKASYRRQFERDKDALRGIGVPIVIEPVDHLGPEVGYRIRPEDYYLPELDLTAEERAALHVAVTAVHLEGGEGREALWKLGGLAGEGAPALATIPSLPELEPLFDAYRRRAVAGFSYRGGRRRLEPYGIVFRRGHWYVVGHDLDRDEPRAFRVDRLTDVEVGEAGTFERPPQLVPTELVRAQPWSFGDEEAIEALLLVDRTQAAVVAEQLGDETVKERRDDGSVLFGVAVTNRSAFLSFVLGLLDHAEVLGPPALREEMVEWLEAVAGGSP
ncbi:MAG: WYL domain-containing protein [Acidimicrobiia bacterium]|nr:WYL domain-containing protein [Acidimicrobiia bacterium]